MNFLTEGKTNWQYLLIILVLAILLGGGILAWQYWGIPKVEVPPVKLPTVTKGEVTINTDKTEYSQGEEVKAELVFEGTIYEWGESGYSIQKWKDNSWKDIFISRGCHPLPDCKNANFEEVKECLGYALCERSIWYRLEKGGEGDWRTKWTWNQTSGEEKLYQCREVNYEWSGGTRVPIYGGIIEEKCMDFQQVPAGKYKIRFEYATAINLDDPFDRNVEIQYTEREFSIK